MSPVGGLAFEHVSQHAGLSGRGGPGSTACQWAFTSLRVAIAVSDGWPTAGFRPMMQRHFSRNTWRGFYLPGRRRRSGFPDTARQEIFSV